MRHDDRAGIEFERALAFDAAMGLFGMIEVVDGGRAEGPAVGADKWEGWILGQAAN